MRHAFVGTVNAVRSSLSSGRPENVQCQHLSKDATVKGVADALTKQTGILFSYDADLNSMSLGDVKVSHKNSSLTSIWTKCLPIRELNIQ